MDFGMTTMLGIFGAVAMLVLVIFMVIRQQKLKDTWVGTIQDKVVNTIKDVEGTSDWHYLHVKLDDGQVVKKQVSKKVYDRFNIGDRAVKVVGAVDPTKAE